MSINNIINIKTTNADVFIGNDVFSVLQEYIRPYQTNKIFILVDENTLQNCVTELITSVDGLKKAEIIEIDSGEENKTIDVCYQLWKTLADYKADRNSLLINLGGGVITDMGGFIASTFKRGMDFINIPTTLLAQIDASVGGKVGVDFEGLKNLIGVFNEPKGVFVYPHYLKTLDKRQMLSGYAEALKHALIKDANYWKALKRGMLSDTKHWTNLITTSINIKNDIVLVDPTEKNERKLLNFGHTIGHAIESYALKNDNMLLLHGEAVAVGMLCEAYISNQVMGLSDKEFKEIEDTINKFYSHFDFDAADFHLLIELMRNDKKNNGGEINFTLISEIGKGHINQHVDIEHILNALTYYHSIAVKKATN
jgi:3-dehydroquinate synthase